jgi:hypothetical protein
MFKKSTSPADRYGVAFKNLAPVPRDRFRMSDAFQIVAPTHPDREDV